MERCERGTASAELKVRSGLRRREREVVSAEPKEAGRSAHGAAGRYPGEAGPQRSPLLPRWLQRDPVLPVPMCRPLAPTVNSEVLVLRSRGGEWNPTAYEGLGE